MKKFLLCAFIIRTALCAFGQGQLYVDNTANTSTSCLATAHGLFFLNTFTGPHPITQDFNLNFYGGSDSANLILLKSFVGPTGAGDNAGPGLFSDPTGFAVTVPGATTIAFFRIEAWLGGPGSTWSSASARNLTSAFTIFSNPVTTPPNVPATLIGMPAIVIGYDEFCNPEPSVLALASLGAAFLFFRRRK